MIFNSGDKLVVVPLIVAIGCGFSGSASFFDTGVGSLSGRPNISASCPSTTGTASAIDQRAYFQEDSGHVPILLGGRAKAFCTCWNLRMTVSIAAKAGE